jgi:ornithine cyclodeaminase
VRTLPALRPHVHDDAEKAVRSAPVLVTVTTSDHGYIPADWLAPGMFVAHVSLDDLLPEVFRSAQAVYVDDVELVTDNPQRILGQLLQSGEAAGHHQVVGTLGQVIVGHAPAVRPSSGHVISNPFGMAVLDVALLAQIHRVAQSEGRGQRWELA